jgi:hypothetical protein
VTRRKLRGDAAEHRYEERYRAGDHAAADELDPLPAA